MPITPDQAEATVRRYLELVAHGTADEIADLYAVDAALEDPVGSPALHGRDAIRAFYATVEPLAITTELVTLRSCAGQAAFHFKIATDTGAGVATMEPLEVMEFDDAGLITSMRAWWNDADLTFE